jgi:hypothetical protein
MKQRATKLFDGSRNTHSTTMSLALRTIAKSSMDNLIRIRQDLENGIKQHKLNQHDAKVLLSKVQREIAERHFH